MKPIIRLIFLTVLGIILYGVGFFGIIGFAHFLAIFLPDYSDMLTGKIMYSAAFFSGLIILMMPFYTLAYFHETKDTELFGFKTPHAKKEAEQDHRVNGRTASARHS